ncbi:MAG: Unknown protein [uncultured Sulfurovum sp.]|uniref:LysM domain-containing protein n=1 Tax=uncultured Sulfurovum sp. TaxID=269237 RepID=A0A6S6SKA5_9BACT|nr:MAG: Unknown protein [uncultured Sulfurovum sp.]
MFDTNDVYNDAVRDSSLHAEEHKNAQEWLMVSKIIIALLIIASAYVGFHFYTESSSVNESLIVKDELVDEVQVKSGLLVESEVSKVVEVFNSEEDYLNALRELEVELTEKKENVKVESSKHLALSSAMNEIMNDALFVDNTNYTNELRKEIDVDLAKDTEELGRRVVVKKGDTLQSISNKFYGDARNYKRIIASNEGLNSDDTIYVGQTILLPY